MSVDEASVRKASAPSAAGQALAQPELRRVLGVFQSSCMQTCRCICYHIRAAILELRWREPKIRERWSPYRSARKERTCQPDPVRARSIGPRALQALHSTLLSVLLPAHASDTASTASPLALDLPSPSTDLQRFFLNRGVQCGETRSFYDDHTVFFRREFKKFLCVLASGRILAVTLSPSVSSLSFPRDRGLCGVRRDLGDCQVCLFVMDAKSPETTCLPPHVCELARACINFLKFLSFLAYPLGSCLWKLRGLQNLISKCVVLDIHHCAFESHWRKATRLLCGGVLLVTCCPPMSFDATENTVCAASAKVTIICSCNAV